MSVGIDTNKLWDEVRSALAEQDIEGLGVLLDSVAPLSNLPPFHWESDEARHWFDEAQHPNHAELSRIMHHPIIESCFRFMEEDPFGLFEEPSSLYWELESILGYIGECAGASVYNAMRIRLYARVLRYMSAGTHQFIAEPVASWGGCGVEDLNCCVRYGMAFGWLDDFILMGFLVRVEDQHFSGLSGRARDEARDTYEFYNENLKLLDLPTNTIEFSLDGSISERHTGLSAEIVHMVGARQWLGPVVLAKTERTHVVCAQDGYAGGDYASSTVYGYGETAYSDAVLRSIGRSLRCCAERILE